MLQGNWCSLATLLFAICGGAESVSFSEVDISRASGKALYPDPPGPQVIIHLQVRSHALRLEIFTSFEPRCFRKSSLSLSHHSVLGARCNIKLGRASGLVLSPPWSCKHPLLVISLVLAVTMTGSKDAGSWPCSRQRGWYPARLQVLPASL